MTSFLKFLPTVWVHVYHWLPKFSTSLRSLIFCCMFGPKIVVLVYKIVYIIIKNFYILTPCWLKTSFFSRQFLGVFCIYIATYLLLVKNKTMLVIFITFFNVSAFQKCIVLQGFIRIKKTKDLPFCESIWKIFWLISWNLICT